MRADGRPGGEVLHQVGLSGRGVGDEQLRPGAISEREKKTLLPSMAVSREYTGELSTGAS